MSFRQAFRLLSPALMSVLAAVFLVFSISGAAAAFKNLKVGESAFPIELRDLDGNAHSLTGLKDSKAILILFWATWSDRSLKEMDDLIKLHASYAGNGLSILAVNVEKQQLAAEDLEKIRAVVAEKKPPFPVLLDEGLKVYNEYGVMVTPTSALVDGAGVMAWEVSGYSSAGTAELEAAVRKALGIATAEETALPKRPGYAPDPVAMRLFGVGKRMVDKTLVDKAIPDLVKSAEADSNYASPRLYLGYAYLRTKQAGGDALVKRAAELDPAAPEPPLLLAYLAAEGGDAAGAIGILDAALEAQKKSSADAVAAGFREEPVPFADLDLSGPRGMGAGEAKAALLSLLGERLAKAGLPMGSSGKKMSLAEKMKARFESVGGGAAGEGAPAPEAPAPEAPAP